MNTVRIFLFFVATLLWGCHSSEIKLLTGTYTDTGSHGIYSLDFDQETGHYKFLDSCNIVNPSYLTISANGRNIYSVSETSDSTASVYALGFNKETGALNIINHRFSLGADPCYIATNGKVAVTANYGGSMSVFPIELNGALAANEYFFEGSTGGPDSVRQNTPHIHCTEFTPDGTKLYVTDFSADKLKVFDVDEYGSIIPLVEGSDNDIAVELDADSGPRHIVFSKSGMYAYVISELSGNVTVLKKDGEVFSPVQVIEADKNHARGAGDIHLSPDGRFLYASVRLVNDGIAVFAIDGNNGKLSPVEYVATGAHPRNFAITPNGKFLLCACRDTNAIEIYSIDHVTGRLTNTGKHIDIAKPVCLKFFPQ